MSRVGSSLRRLLFVEVRADPPSANGIFACNVRQIDQEALLRISYFPPRPRTKKAESARQCPNLDGALPTNVLANTFPFSLHEGRIFRNEKSGRGIRCRSIVSSKVSSSRPVHSPETLPVRFCCCREVVCDFRPLPAGANSQPFRQAERNRVYSNCRGEKWKKNSTISSSRAQSSLLELPRREMEEKFNHFVKPSATEFTRIAEARNGRTKFNRNGRSSDSFRLRRLPDPEVSGKRVSHTFAPPKREAGTYSSGNCSGFTPDSHLIPSVGALRRASENRCRAKITIFSKHAADSPIFLTEKGGRRQPAASFQPHGRRRFRRLAVR